jgi:hypothetical protein
VCARSENLLGVAIWIEALIIKKRLYICVCVCENIIVVKPI